MILTIIFAVILTILAIARRRKDDEDDVEMNSTDGIDPDEAGYADGYTYTEERTVKFIRKGWLILGIIVAVIAVILFLLTQDITQPSAWFDKWTWLFGVLLIVEFLCFILAFGKKTETEEDYVEYMYDTPYAGGQNVLERGSQVVYNKEN